MIEVEWREARHPNDQALIDVFACAEQHQTRRKRPDSHPEPYAIEVQGRLRGLLKDSTKNSRRLDWRYLVAILQDGSVAAALVHRRAPDIATGRLPDGVPARLLIAAAVRLDLRKVACKPSGERLSDQAIRIACLDAGADAAGGVLFAEVDPRNTRMRIVLERNGFERGAPTSDGHLLYATVLHPNGHQRA